MVIPLKEWKCGGGGGGGGEGGGLEMSPNRHDTTRYFKSTRIIIRFTETRVRVRVQTEKKTTRHMQMKQEATHVYLVLYTCAEVFI